MLIVTSATDHFGLYYGEILQAEGLPEYDTVDVATLTPEVLSHYTTVVLAQLQPSDGVVTALTNWVQAGRQSDRDAPGREAGAAARARDVDRAR